MARILVIDDDEQIRNMLHIMLKNEGYDVAEAPEGKVALELFSRAPFDVVITDIVMPEKEGLETIMALDGARALCAEFTFTIPVKLDWILSAVKMLIEHAQ